MQGITKTNKRKDFRPSLWDLDDIFIYDKRTETDFINYNLKITDVKSVVCKTPLGT